MKEIYIKLKIESVVNKILYQKKRIEKDIFQETAIKLEKLLFEENNKNSFDTYIQTSHITDEWI